MNGNDQITANAAENTMNIIFNIVNNELAATTYLTSKKINFWTRDTAQINNKMQARRAAQLCKFYFFDHGRFESKSRNVRAAFARKWQRHWQILRPD